jgi:hypothetical protein
MENIDSILEEIALAFVGQITSPWSIAFDASLERAELDFSLLSLRSLDSYLSTLHPHGGELSDDLWNTTVLWAGAYLGEVIRRQAQDELHWEEPCVEEDAAERHKGSRPLEAAPVLKRKEGTFIRPIQYVADFMDAGPTLSTFAYATSQLNHTG